MSIICVGNLSRDLTLCYNVSNVDRITTIEWIHLTQKLTISHLGHLHREHQGEGQGGDDEKDGAQGQQQGAEAHSILTKSWNVQFSEIFLFYF